ncbi:MAG: DUF460 domain-containing protein [Nanoarchaeota archaeon]
MGEKQLLIVGVDPGTTMGYAVLDIECNLVEAGSGKNMDMGILISKLISLGKPLIIAGDKKKNPDFVERLAVKLGARLIGPDYDLKVIEKRDLTRDFKTANQHETDALASAVFAFKKISSLIKKINVFVDHHGKENIRTQLIDFVVGKELNIRDAADIIEKPEKEDIKIIEEVVEERKLNEKDFLNLYAKLKSSRKDVSLLQQQNRKLKNQISNLKKDYEYMFRKISRSEQDNKMKSILGFKEKRISFLDAQLNRKQDVIDLLRDEITTLFHFLSSLNTCVLIKKLSNLGLDEMEKKKNILNIRKGDILLVEDPDIFSNKVVSELRGKVEIIFYKKPVSKKVESVLPFVFIGAGNLPIEENVYFAILDKENLQKARHKKDILAKVISDYKKERE